MIPANTNRASRKQKKAVSQEDAAGLVKLAIEQLLVSGQLSNIGLYEKWLAEETINLVIDCLRTARGAGFTVIEFSDNEGDRLTISDIIKDCRKALRAVRAAA